MDMTTREASMLGLGFIVGIAFAGLVLILFT